MLLLQISSTTQRVAVITDIQYNATSCCYYRYPVLRNELLLLQISSTTQRVAVSADIQYNTTSCCYYRYPIQHNVLLLVQIPSTTQRFAVSTYIQYNATNLLLLLLLLKRSVMQGWQRTCCQMLWVCQPWCLSPLASVSSFGLL